VVEFVRDVYEGLALSLYFEETCECSLLGCGVSGTSMKNTKKIVTFIKTTDINCL
jgi:hypothetical protein